MAGSRHRARRHEAARRDSQDRNHRVRVLADALGVLDPSWEPAVDRSIRIHLRRRRPGLGKAGVITEPPDTQVVF